MSYFFFFYRSTSLSLCTVFDSILSNIDEVLSINSSANVFVSGILTFIRRTDQLIMVELVQLVNCRSFSRSGSTRTVALDTSKAFYRACHAGVFCNLRFMQFQVRYLTAFLLFLVIGAFE